MDQFGVQKPELKAMARTPQLPQTKTPSVGTVARDTAPINWLGATVRNIVDAGEMSAYGLPGVTGVLVLNVPADSALSKAGLQKNDVILSVSDEKTADKAALLRLTPASPFGQILNIIVSRDQKEKVIRLAPGK